MVIVVGKVYNLIIKNKNYPGTIAWRVKEHAHVIEIHLNPDEIPLYAFAGQKNDRFCDIFSSCVVALTNKRILIGTKRVLWGYYLTSITPDLYNDMKVYQGLIWGKVTIDTVKELVTISNLSKNILPEVETKISEFMIKAKKEYYQKKAN